MRRHHRAVGGRRADDRSHRRGLEHHLEPQRRPRPEAVPVVGAVQAGLGHRGRRRRARRQRQVVGRQARHRPVTVWPRGADIQERVNAGSYDVVDVATGSSGTLNLPDDYVRTDTPSAGIEQLIFAPAGPLADPAGAPRGGAVHPPRPDRPQRRGADRQHPAEPRRRGSITAAESRRRGADSSASPTRRPRATPSAGGR